MIQPGSNPHGKRQLDEQARRCEKRRLKKKRRSVGARIEKKSPSFWFSGRAASERRIKWSSTKKNFRSARSFARTNYTMKRPNEIYIQGGGV